MLAYRSLASAANAARNDHNICSNGSRDINTFPRKRNNVRCDVNRDLTVSPPRSSNGCRIVCASWTQCLPRNVNAPCSASKRGKDYLRYSADRSGVLFRM